MTSSNKFSINDLDQIVVIPEAKYLYQPVKFSSYHESIVRERLQGKKYTTEIDPVIAESLKAKPSRCIFDRKKIGYCYDLSVLGKRVFLPMYGLLEQDGEYVITFDGCIVDTSLSPDDTRQKIIEESLRKLNPSSPNVVWYDRNRVKFSDVSALSMRHIMNQAFRIALIVTLERESELYKEIQSNIRHGPYFTIGMKKKRKVKTSLEPLNPFRKLIKRRVIPIVEKSEIEFKNTLVKEIQRIWYYKPEE